MLPFKAFCGTLDAVWQTDKIVFRETAQTRSDLRDGVVKDYTFTYNASLQLDTETLPTALYGSVSIPPMCPCGTPRHAGRDDKILTRKYETTGLPGRSAGFQLGTAADPDADQDITYTYQPATGRFASVTDELRTQTFSYGYLPNSDLLETTTLLNNVVLTKAYESNRNFVDYVQNTVGAATVSKYDYENDPAGRRTQAVRTGSAFDQANFDLWGYNTRSELTSSHRYQGSDPGDTSNPVTVQFYDYAYDPIGNRLGATIGNPNDPEPVEGSCDTTYTTNSLNQYTSVTSVPSVVNPTYDDDGNMTFLPSTTGGGAGGEGWLCQWNAAQDEVQLAARTGSNERSEWQNRLTAAEKPGDTKLEFAYDYMGRRISKKVYSWQTDTWQLDTSLVFLYDSWNLIAELDALNNNATVRSYTWGLDLSQSLQGAGGIGGLLAIHDADSAAEQSETGQPTGGSEASKSYAVTYDANGNVGQLIDLADGSTAAHYEYSPFGQPLTATGPAADLNPFRFSTKYTDAETGLSYYGFRYYNPRLGRWISRDPIGERGGWNVYGFVGNGATGVDLLGLAVAPATPVLVTEYATLWDSDWLNANDKVATFMWRTRWECDADGLKLDGAFGGFGITPHAHSDVLTASVYGSTVEMDGTWDAVVTHIGTGTWEEFSIWNTIVGGMTGAAGGIIAGASTGATIGGATGTIALPIVGTVGGATGGAIIGGILFGAGGAIAGGAQFLSVTATYKSDWRVACRCDLRANQYVISRHKFIGPEMVGAGDLYWHVGIGRN